MLKTNKQLTFRMRTDAQHTPPEISNKFSKLTAKLVAILIGTTLVLASCSSDITDSASGKSVTNTQTSSHYVIKGLFEEKKDACTIEGKQFKDGKLTTIDSKKASINTEGSMEIADNLPKGDYYYITCTGNYIDETTQKTSTQPVKLKGFFSEANGVNNINVFTDMIAEHVQDELTKKLSSTPTPSPNPNEASIFKQINEAASKAIVKVMPIKEEEANEINDVSLLDSAHPSSAGDIALLIANINILKNHDFSGNDLAIKPQFDATTGEVKADSIENIADPLTAKANLKLVDDAIKATDDKVKREDFDNIGDFSKLDDKPAVTDNKPAVTDATGEHKPKVETPKPPASPTITFQGQSTIGTSKIKETGGKIAVNPFIEPLPATAPYALNLKLTAPIPFTLKAEDIQHATATASYYITSDKAKATAIALTGTDDKHNDDIVSLFKDRPVTDYTVATKFTICILKSTAKAGDCVNGTAPSDKVITKKSFTLERHATINQFTSKTTFGKVPLTTAPGKIPTVAIVPDSYATILQISPDDFSLPDWGTATDGHASTLIGVLFGDRRFSGKGVNGHGLIGIIPKRFPATGSTKTLTFCLVPYASVTKAAAERFAYDQPDCTKAIRSAQVLVTVKAAP